MFLPNTTLQYTHSYRGRLDTIGLAGFSHDFWALAGKPSVIEVFDTFVTSPRTSALNICLFFLAQTFPFLVWLPAPCWKLLQKLNVAIEESLNELLARTQKELAMGAVGGKEEKSIIGLLSMRSISHDPLHVALTYYLT
jgi:hypothetical protein